MINRLAAPNQEMSREGMIMAMLLATKIQITKASTGGQKVSVTKSQ